MNAQLDIRPTPEWARLRTTATNARDRAATVVATARVLVTVLDTLAGLPEGSSMVGPFWVTIEALRARLDDEVSALTGPVTGDHFATERDNDYPR